MTRKQLTSIIRHTIKEMRLQEVNYANHNFKYSYLSKVGISKTDITEMEKIYNKIASKTGDEGSAVLGNGILINGKIAIESYAQGSIGLERIQKEIIPFLKKKYPNLKISYAWGNMD